ncbi:MAG: antibiotic biosynthesis monooxygenase [Chloroflexi bacterium]|nr:antibiotic biosynthesis monooxygenase [Chloroflexota bacterium]
MNLENQVRSILLLQPRNNDYAALVALFTKHDILGLAIREAGCLGAELQVPVSRTGPVLVTAVWRTVEAYAGWRSHPVRARFSGDIERFTEPDASPVQAGLYTIAIAAAT